VGPLSYTGKRWIEPAREASGAPVDIVRAIAEERGLGGESRAWMDAGTYPMAAKAAERVQRAIRKGETIAVVGDYDCDGLTSTAVLVRLLRRLGGDPVVRIPHRLKEGYGLQPLHVDEMLAKGATLLLTVDTGIVATGALERAKGKGLDVIVLDHHHFAELPPAYAILHPSLTELRSAPAAAGVAFAFAHAMLGETWPDRDTDLALAAIGTIADVVPLTHENRAMVKDGLAALARLDPSSGVGMLRDRSNAGRVPTSSDVAFRMAPRLNAAGRLDDAEIGLRALLGDEASVDLLETLNAERQRLTQACMEEAFGMVDDSDLPACICVASPNFPKGIIGLIAGKLAEKYGRPAAAVAIMDGVCTSSLRGIPGHDIAGALRTHAHLFTAFGGHAQAGGCSFEEANLPAVKQALHDDVLAYVRPEALRPSLALDLSLPASSATIALADALAALEPFGAENREPLFLVENVVLTGVRTVGADNRHLQARMGQTGIIAFGLGHLAATLAGPVDLACRVTANEWNGTRKAQLSVVDIRVADQTGASLPSISNTAITGTLRAEAIL
jgi:single-stranded-DNA-specific exonuclease